MAPPPAEFEPFVPADESPDELTLAPLLLGAVLGVVFGAASMYLVLKVGLTVSASIPVAVLAITLFKAFGKATILQNNIVQTTGSAGESIAFGVGLVMPALLTLGFDLDAVRVMTVGVLGGLLGILMMIPLRRAFVVQQHGILKYPEGTACADVLIVGEKGGATARTLFAGFGLGFVFEFVTKGFKLWKAEPEQALYATDAAGKTVGLKAGVLGCEMSAPLLGVGYIIGPRIASIMVAGGILADLIITPIIATATAGPLAAAGAAPLEPGDIRKEYVLFIGAGAVAAGGILSMIRALPVIVSSVAAGFRDLRTGRGPAGAGGTPRPERDLPMAVVLAGSLGLVLALAAVPSLGLGLNLAGVAGAVMILAFGFLFVTVSSRLTGEIGSSSNPISGMTVATLLLTCLVLTVLGETGVLVLSKETKLLALTIAGVVCVACSNGGTTSQALKTGHLLGATPRAQQYAILAGSLTSALVVGLVLIQMNLAGTIYSKLDLPAATVRAEVLAGTTERVRVGQYADDPTEYRVLLVGAGEVLPPSAFVGAAAEVPPGKYLIDAAGKFAYLVDPAVNGKLKLQDNGEKAGERFKAPKTQLFLAHHQRHLRPQLALGLGVDRRPDRRRARTLRRARTAVRGRHLPADFVLDADICGRRGARRRGPLPRGRRRRGRCQSGRAVRLGLHRGRQHRGSVGGDRPTRRGLVRRVARPRQAAHGHGCRTRRRAVDGVERAGNSSVRATRARALRRRPAGRARGGRRGLVRVRRTPLRRPRFRWPASKPASAAPGS